MSGRIPLGRLLPRIGGATTPSSAEAELPPLRRLDGAEQRRRSAGRGGGGGEEEATKYENSSEEASCSSEESAPKMLDEAEARRRSYQSTSRPSSRRSQRAYRTSHVTRRGLDTVLNSAASTTATMSNWLRADDECSSDDAVAPSRGRRGTSPNPDARAVRSRRRDAAGVSRLAYRGGGVVEERISFASTSSRRRSNGSALAPIFGARVVTSTAPRLQNVAGQRRRAERDVLFPSLKA